MAKYLTGDVFNVFWAGLKTKLRAKVDVRDGYSLTKNDLTDALKANYDAAYQNRVTGVTVNGAVNAEKASFSTTASGEDNYATRTLNIVMPTTLQELTNSETDKFATEAYVGNTAYTKTEIDTKLGNLGSDSVATLIANAASGKLVMQKVATLPTGNDIQANHIYLVPKATADGESNVCDEYIVVDDEGTLRTERVGDTSVDLSGYQTTSAFNTWKTSDYDVFKNSIETLTTAEIQELLAEDTTAGATDAPAGE